MDPNSLELGLLIEHMPIMVPILICEYSSWIGKIAASGRNSWEWKRVILQLWPAVVTRILLLMSHHESKASLQSIRRAQVLFVVAFSIERIIGPTQWRPGWNDEFGVASSLNGELPTPRCDLRRAITHALALLMGRFTPYRNRDMRLEAAVPMDLKL